MPKYTLRIKIAVLTLCAALMLTASPCVAKTDNTGSLKSPDTSTLPVIKLKHWQQSTTNERFAFLSGFVSMLELESEWQGNSPLPFKKSLISSWKKGLSGLTLKDLYEGINAYMIANPADMERPVVEIIWFKFVQPKITDKLNKK